MRFCDISVRPGDRAPFLETHGNSVRLGRSANCWYSSYCKNRLVGCCHLSAEKKLIYSVLLNTTLATGGATYVTRHRRAARGLLESITKPRLSTGSEFCIFNRFPRGHYLVWWVRVRVSLGVRVMVRVRVRVRVRVSNLLGSR